MKLTSIPYEEVEFFQTPEKGKTVAYVSGHQLDAYLDFLMVSHQKPPADYLDIPEEFMMPYELKAISTCHSPDKWDDESGKKQAYYKLIRMYNKMKSRAITRGIDSYKNQVECMNKLVKDYSTRVSTYDRLVRFSRKREVQ